MGTGMVWIYVMLGILVLLSATTTLLLIIRLIRAKPFSTVLIEKAIERLELQMERNERSIREEGNRGRDATGTALREGRAEQAEALKNVADTLYKQLATVSANLDHKYEIIRESVEARLKSIQQENGIKLDQMRATVDEKLQTTLEKRLGASFSLVSERLEQVQKGLGEMRELAHGVGDLKKVLTNVKTRGIWGEVQLGAMLEQIFNREQYEENVATKGTTERVEFALRLPGRDGLAGDHVWLPIDSKFPLEDYQRLLAAQEAGQADLAEQAGNQLVARVKACAKDIREKYLAPPLTTPFAILFLPTEGLFAEVIRRMGILDEIQKEHQVIIAGPTTLYAMLTSLQMGFRTLAIEQRSHEVWKLLGEVKTEWSKYGDVLDRLQKQLQAAVKTVDHAQTRTRVIGKRLKNVEALPLTDASEWVDVEAEENGSDGAGEEGGVKTETQDMLPLL